MSPMRLCLFSYYHQRSISRFIIHNDKREWNLSRSFQFLKVTRISLDTFKMNEQCCIVGTHIISLIDKMSSNIYIWLFHAGKTCGLCGTFNDNQNDDFTKADGEVVVSPLDFGDSWRTQYTCPVTKVVPHPCTTHKERHNWSHKQCNVINHPDGDFKECHKVVDPRPYFDACYYDTCGCDLGGDCECLCTAISAYADACNKHNVHIKWRHQGLCRK